jgi:hypothetical protein
METKNETITNIAPRNQKNHQILLLNSGKVSYHLFPAFNGHYPERRFGHGYVTRDISQPIDEM